MKKEIKERIEMINNGEVPEGYKKTKLGIIPEEWQIYEMDHFFTFKNGINASKDKYGSGIKFINTLEVLNNNAIAYSDIKGSVEISDKKLIKNSVKKGDILFNRTSETADEIAKSAVYTSDETVTFGGFIIRATENRDDFDLNYKKYAFNSNLMRREFKKRGQGISRINIGQNELGNVPVILLLKNEQKQIANILQTWDEAIELKEKLLEKKKDIKKGLIKSLLTGKVRLKGFDAQWGNFQLSNFVKKRKGKVVKNNINGKYPCIDMKYITTGTPENFTNEEGVKAVENDILILWDGSRAGKVYTGYEGVIGSTIAVLNPKAINGNFLAKLLQLGSRRIRSLTEGSGIPHVPSDFIKVYKIYIPTDIDEQNAITDILSKSDQSIELLEKEIELLREEKKGLMQLLLTGKVRVNETN